MSNVPPPPSGGGFPPPGGPPPGGQPPGTPGPLAEWQDRLVSGLIDYVGPMFLAGFLGFFIDVAVDTRGAFFSPFQFLFAVAAVGWGIYNGYLAGETGQSYGMKQSGLRLVGEQTGQPIGGSQGAVRNLLFIANLICCGGIVLLVDALFPLWDPKKQTLRDKIGKSVVIKTG